jgi:hypothetical protein
MLALSTIVVAFVVVSADKPAGSCGGDKPSKVLDCQNVDMGSCGNACCKLLLHVQEDPVTAAKLLNTSLANGGPDGYYTRQFLAEKVTGFFDLSVLKAGLPVIGQVHHMTSGPAHYNDTIDITITKTSSGSVIKAFSISLIGGALGDNGQNYKNIVMALKSVAWILPEHSRGLIHADESCQPPSTSMLEDCKPMTDSDPCFHSCHPGMHCTAEICSGLGKIGCKGTQCQLMGDSGSATAHCMSPMGGLVV